MKSRLVCEITAGLCCGKKSRLCALSYCTGMSWVTSPAFCVRSQLVCAVEMCGLVNGENEGKCWCGCGVVVGGM